MVCSHGTTSVAERGSSRGCVMVYREGVLTYRFGINCLGTRYENPLWYGMTGVIRADASPFSRHLTATAIVTTNRSHYMCFKDSFTQMRLRNVIYLSQLESSLHGIVNEHVKPCTQKVRYQLCTDCEHLTLIWIHVSPRWGACAGVTLSYYLIMALGLVDTNFPEGGANLTLKVKISGGLPGKQYVLMHTKVTQPA